MNLLFENSNIQANCEKCGIDEPFYMPLARTDFNNIRLQLPYHLITANGGGLPLGANVRVSLVNEAGTTQLCDLGGANGGRFLFGYYNNPTSKIAEYKFILPQPFADEVGKNYTWRYFDVNVGQHVVITGTGTDADGEFTYGIDPTPPIFNEIKSGRLAFPIVSTAVIWGISLNGVGITAPLMFINTSCAHENFNCFRVKIAITFPISGVTKEYFTKPFKIVRCDDTIKLKGTFSGLSTDCNGYVHDGIWTNPIADHNFLFLRIPAQISKTSNRVKKTYNNKCFSIKGERTPAFKLNSSPMPDYFVEYVENILIAKETLYDNSALLLPDSDALFSDIGVQGYQYKFLDITLTACKCEITYSC